jgi:response regulator RpfG family c-di-GMP phosphodiesterase
MRNAATAVRYCVVLIGEKGPRLDAYRAGLRAGGFWVFIAHDVDEAVRLLTAVCHDVCVVDEKSLHEKAWELCASIRAVPPLRTLPLVVLSTRGGRPRGALQARARRWRCTILTAAILVDDLVDAVATVIACRASSRM